MTIVELVRVLARCPAEDRAAVLAGLSETDKRAIAEEWTSSALAGQAPPEGEWRTWLIMAGRGFGKTRAGAEWVLSQARANRGARIALIGGSIDEVVKVMVEGDSGLIASARLHEKLAWRPSSGQMRLPGDGLAIAYSGANPNRLRGPQHHFAWADEIAKWAYPQATWDNLQLGLRLGMRPRAVVTTTPGAPALLKQLIADRATRLSRGRTDDNPYLPSAFIDAVTAAYGGTHLARQELGGELIGEAQGALWTRATIEACRCAMPERGALARVVVAVDPPASAHGDACGIVVAGRLADGRGVVLADCSASGQSPRGWARLVAAAADAWAADRVIAEANNGGEMVGEVLRTIDARLPIKLVHATRGKGARAEPVAALFEARRCLFAGGFPALEDELAALTADGARGPSPDRADAMVWALTELILRAATPPRVRGL